jgi:sulfate adenylyltransferase subunit 1 (EFTu-like GTPase family)
MTLDLLRFTTAGSVDDGKSTLIGRLLYDTKQVHDDQLLHLIEASLRRGGEGALDLALLTDGLRAEREQGITIDVAYRYFATERRRFIIADCPGHLQYTRNMATGASTADLAVVLIDARHGVVEQSRRHAFISALLGIPRLVVAINKMDLVEHAEQRFDEIVAQFAASAAQLSGVKDITYIPISALQGDNVVTRSARMDWYEGTTLLDLLETVDVSYDHPDEIPARFPVQWVVRPAATASASEPPSTNGHHSSARHHAQDDPDYRGYAGTLASGALHVGDDVVVLPAGQRTSIAAIDTFDGPLEEALAPMSVTLRLADNLDISRGELICRPNESPSVTREFEADICWLAEQPMRPGGRYVLKHTTRQAPAIIDALLDLVDVHSLERVGPPAELNLNDIARVRVRTSAPLIVDPYDSNRRTGSFILIDEASNGTVGAGMIRSA